MNMNRKTLSFYWQHTKKYKRQLWTIYPMMTVAQIMEDFLQPILISGILDKLARNDLDSLQGSRIWWIFAGILALELTAHTM